MDHDPWSRPYKTVKNKIKPDGNSTRACPVFLDMVVRHLFSENGARPAGTGLSELSEAIDPQEISKAELI